MKTSRVAILPVLLLTLAACTGDDGSSEDRSTATEPASTDPQTGDDGDGLTEDQQAAADQFMDQEGAAAVFDRECVEETAAKLSDEDARAIAEAGPDGDPRVSPEGEVLRVELAQCADNAAVIDFVVESLREAGEQFDEQCVRDALQDLDMAAIANDATGESTEEMFSALDACAPATSEG